MITIYDLKECKLEIRQIQNKIKQGLSGYRTKWGLFGSDEWFRNIRKENLVKIVEGKVSRIYMAGHNDFPMFEVTCGNGKYEFAIVGDKNRYKIGSKIIVECLLNENIRPSSGLEKVLEPIKIEIEI